jgi:hypothetical protein
VVLATVEGATLQRWQHMTTLGEIRIVSVEEVAGTGIRVKFRARRDRRIGTKIGGPELQLS